MSEYVAQTFEHIVLKSDPWELIDLNPNWHLATTKQFDVYTDRAQAIAAIKAVYPDFEAQDWVRHEEPETVTVESLQAQIDGLLILLAQE